MAVEFICDGCGKREPCVYGYAGDAHKPGQWFQRFDKEKNKALHACSRACVDRTADKTGSHRVILPF